MNRMFRMAGPNMGRLYGCGLEFRVWRLGRTAKRNSEQNMSSYLMTSYNHKVLQDK